VDSSNEAKITFSEGLGNPKYSVITPVKNEAEFIEETIRSMCEQTVTPVEWVIVNDGSTDETAELVATYAVKHPWIKLVTRENRGGRRRGKGVVEAFYKGYETLTQEYDFIVKLDGDLSFEPNYFESLLREFASNPNLGISGGGVYEKRDGKHWVLYSYKKQVRGPTKLYRRACFEAIGGLVPALGWDRIDEWRALSMGWEVYSCPELRVYHQRATGAATGLLKSRIEQGCESHYMGYHPLFLIARGIRYMFHQPYLIGGMIMIMTYFIAGLQGREKLPDPSLIRYIRRTQLRQLVGLMAGKPVHE
jgi:biofilm PGA synthesis N-glycosyltransferase PgaC